MTTQTFPIITHFGETAIARIIIGKYYSGDYKNFIYALLFLQYRNLTQDALIENGQCFGGHNAVYLLNSTVKQL